MTENSTPESPEAGADERSPDRLIALSDGIFAIAMTLLVLDIHVPPGLHAAQFRHMVGELLPNLGAYALSFAILAGFWRDHRRILHLARAADGRLVRLTLAGLGVIALLPFPTTMLSEYASQPLAVAIYAGNIVVIDLLHLALFLAIRYRPGIAYPISVRRARAITADLASTILVFGATIPIAFVSPTAALWTWLTLLPIRLALGRANATHPAGAG
ncbi:TMEM175 family protein [Embleya sp. AB8]|uniref:TMEM175 family protein n=1 Tax=Embleya sp. AB8 TaxID=3156304 RepID=UPI003C72DB33